MLPAVFDYGRQALLYQPALPAYDWRNADRYYDAVAEEMTRLLEASRGRALCLFTSWSGLQQVRDRLVDGAHFSIWPIRFQGDAPRDALLAWFKETPYSVLLATRSFWEGVDIPGDDLSLVVLDKMPFPTPGDPLHSARMSNIDESGQSSFGNYMLPLMTLALKQGFGRLIRRTTDQGVVAILDERLTSKGYGRQARQDLPPARFSRNFSDVHQFFRHALDSQADFVLNVWALAGESAASPWRWRWQLLRLQDGKSDVQEGQSSQSTNSMRAEIEAAIAGLQDLRNRVEKVNRTTDQFGVELRCSPDAMQQMQIVDTQEGLLLQWLAEKARWKRVDLLGVNLMVATAQPAAADPFGDSATDFELANDGNPF
ncbi:MAG: ATP-dependent DNA helicase [Caldilineaceae bacterium]